MTRPKISDLALEAFVAESISHPHGALDTIYFVAEVLIGSLANKNNVMDYEKFITNNKNVHSFLSEYLSVLQAQLAEADYGLVNLIQLIGDAVVPGWVEKKEEFGGNELFAEERFPNSHDINVTLLNNPMTSIVVLLRIHVEKLLALVNSLGEYKTSFEAELTRKP